MIFLVPFSQLPTTMFGSLTSGCREVTPADWILVSISALSSSHGFGAASAVALNKQGGNPQPATADHHVRVADFVVAHDLQGVEVTPRLDLGLDLRLEFLARLRRGQRRGAEGNPQPDGFRDPSLLVDAWQPVLQRILPHSTAAGQGQFAGLGKRSRSAVEAGVQADLRVEHLGYRATGALVGDLLEGLRASAPTR